METGERLMAVDYCLCDAEAFICQGGSPVFFVFNQALGVKAL